MGAPVTKDLLKADLKAALKGGDRLRVSTLRLTLDAIKYREIELGKPLDGPDLLAIFAAGIKKRREAIEGYQKGGRQDLVDQETAEMKILQAYLPPSLSEEEIKELVEQSIRETGASGQKDIGAVMKWLMPKVSGRADGRLINQIVKARLA